MGLPINTTGKDFNFFQKVTVTSGTFATTSDIVIPFPTQGIMLLNEDTTDVVEFSYRGNTVHGELDPTLPSRALTFDGIKVCAIWFRLKSGTSAVISVYGWSAG